MELIQFISITLVALGPIKFYSKFSFVFLLFILNIYLFFSKKMENNTNSPSVGLASLCRDNKNKVEPSILQAGLNINNLKSLLTYLGTIGGLLSASITIKNELKNTQMGKLDQLMEAERAGIRKSIDQDRETHQKILESIDSNRDELLNLHIEKAKLFGQIDRLLTLHNSIKTNIVSYQDKSVDPTSKLSDLGFLDQLIKQDTNKFSQELNSLILNIGNPLDPSGLEDSSSSAYPKGGEGDTLDNLKDLKESSVFNFNIFTSMDWFEGLNGIKKLAVCLILGKGVIFSALLSVIFIFYGNILIEKYDLENKYPRLAKIIQLRRKFQKYYFNYYCFLILLVVFSETIFALTILTF